MNQRSLHSILLAIALLALPARTAAQAHADTALTYVGAMEVGTNTGAEVELFLGAVDLPGGYPWCAAFVSYVLNAAGSELLRPTTRTALARGFIDGTSVKASRVLRGTYTPRRGDLAIWQRGNTRFGHVVIVLSWNGECGITVEGNTLGTYHDGIEGVWIKRRCIVYGAYFRLTHFTPFSYTTSY